MTASSSRPVRSNAVTRGRSARSAAACAATNGGDGTGSASASRGSILSSPPP
nr:hypothetical protein [Mycolicibacterium insubricum]